MDDEAIKQRISELRIEHRHLDELVTRLTTDGYPNELHLRRLKKRRLMLRDAIIQFERMLTPDSSA